MLGVAGVTGADLVDEEPPAQEFWLWPENVDAWTLFLRCSTQWRGNGMRREGLDYQGVEIVMQRTGVRRRLRQQRFSEIQAMETACLEVWSRQLAEQAQG